MSNTEERLFNELFIDIKENGKKDTTTSLNRWQNKDIYAVEYPNNATGVIVSFIVNAVKEKGNIVYFLGTKENLAEVHYEYFHQ